MAGTIAPNIVTDGLVLYLDAANTKSYVSGSTTWNDMSGFNNNGTLVNGPTFNNVGGGSLGFNNSSIYNSVNFTNINLASGSFSLLFYISLSTLGLATQFFQLGGGSYGNFPDNTPGISIGIPAGLPQSFRAQITDGSVNRRVQVDNFGFEANKFTYINYVLDRTAGVANVYKDGRLVGGPLSLNPLGTSSIANNITSFFIPGNCASFFIYNRALSQQEVLQNYNATKTRFGL